MGKNKNKLLEEPLIEKFINEGYEALSEKERLYILLRFSEKKDFETRAEELLQNYGSIRSIINAEPQLLMKSAGISDISATLFRLISRISKVYSEESDSIRRLNTSENAKEYFKNHYMGISVEQLTAVMVKKNLEISSIVTIAVGSGTGITTSCHEIANYAFTSEERQLFIAHNHPLGKAEPSEADIVATRNIISALNALEVRLIDHIIVGASSVLSMRETGCCNALSQSPDCGYAFSRQQPAFPAHYSGS